MQMCNKKVSRPNSHHYRWHNNNKRADQVGTLRVSSQQIYLLAFNSVGDQVGTFIGGITIIGV